jgi:hypothetical protein
MTETVQVISEEDLLKSIQELETKTVPDPKDPPKTPEVVKVELVKSTSESLREGASPTTKKALDVSDALSDLIGLLGAHNDSALATLQKSINSGAERDLATVKVLSDLKKSVEALAEKVEAWGQEPTRNPKSTTTTEVLHKGGGNGAIKLDPRTARRQITQGLEMLAKSLRPDDPKFHDLTQAAIRFEATGQIEDRHVAAAQRALANSAE